MYLDVEAKIEFIVVDDCCYLNTVKFTTCVRFLFFCCYFYYYFAVLVKWLKGSLSWASVCICENPEFFFFLCVIYVCMCVYRFPEVVSNEYLYSGNVNYFSTAIEHLRSTHVRVYMQLVLYMYVMLIHIALVWWSLCLKSFVCQAMRVGWVA